jgi:hypothetical protein
MNRADQICLTCVQALEKGLIPVAGGWNKSKAAALLSAIQARQMHTLPICTQPAEVFDAIVDILAGLEGAEPRYVPRWAREMLAG